MKKATPSDSCEGNQTAFVEHRSHIPFAHVGVTECGLGWIKKAEMSAL